MEILVAVLLVLAVLGGSILGIVAFSQNQQLTRRLRDLEWELGALRKRLDDLGDRPAAQLSQEKEPEPVDPTPAPASASVEPARVEPRTTATPTAARTAPSPPSKTVTPSAFDHFFAHVTENWMVWLGGVSLGLAGVFLAVYSIEQGYLGPTARIVLGALAGLGMWAGAEYLRRKTGESSNVFAALAAAGSISLFSASLAGHHLYELISLELTFATLTIVALATMALALLHGPMLAALGLLGAYVVPILLSSGSGLAFVALLYALVISGAALSLLRFVYRDWLWWGVIVGGLGWWALTLGAQDVVGWRMLYLTIFGALLLMVPHLDLLLKRTNRLAQEHYAPRNWLSVTPSGDRWLLPVFAALAAAQAFSILVENTYEGRVWALTPMLMLTLLAARGRESLNVVPALLLAFTAAAWLMVHLDDSDGRLTLRWVPPVAEGQFLVYLGITATIALVGGLWNYGTARFKALWAAFSSLTPVLLMVVGYLVTDRHAPTWAIGALILGLIYLIVASAFVKRTSLESLVVWLYFGGQLAITTAAAIALTPDTLTVVLAVQLVSCVLLMRAFSVDLVWLIKIIASALIVRLTLNPWLLTYPSDVHWTLWTYGGSVALALIALYLLPKDDRPHLVSGRQWLEGAALHLGVLFLWTELRYWLHDGDVFAGSLTAMETGLYVVLFGLIALTYFMRSKVSEHVAWLYVIFSRIAAVAALGSYAILLFATVSSEPWLYRDISTTPILNLGLLLYGAPVLVFLANYLFGDPRMRKAEGWLTAGAAFIYVNMQIRHVFSESYRIDTRFTDQETVTYSVVWLVMAVVVLLRGSSAGNQIIYRAGMALLAVVIGKIFLVDMAGLEGLLRVVSFFGLGLALLGLSFLHQRLSRGERVSGGD